MSTHPQPEGCTAPDEQLRRELELLVQRHAEFSRRLESILAELEAKPFTTPVNPESMAERSPQSAGARRELWLLSDRISHAEDHLDAVARQLELTSGRVQEIMESRTWKLFTGMGGLLLKLAGRR